MDEHGQVVPAPEPQLQPFVLVVASYAGEVDFWLHITWGSLSISHILFVVFCVFSRASSAQPVTYITEDGTVVGYGDQSDDLAQMSLVPDATDSSAVPGGFQYKGDVKPVLLPRPKIKSEPIIEHLTADDDSEEKVTM